MAEGLVSANGFAVDASLIAADANKQRSVPSSDWDPPKSKITRAAWRANILQRSMTPRLALLRP
jgi:hypothetical protein